MSGTRFRPRAAAAVAAVVLGATAAAAVDTPIAADFSSFFLGEVVVGETSDTFTLTLTNTGADPFGPITIAGGFPGAPFGALQDCGGVTLASQEACHFYYTFSPTAFGLVDGESNFTIGPTSSPADAETFTIGLRGKGVSPIDVSPLCVAFPETALGSTSAPIEVTVTNRGTSPFPIHFAGGAPLAPFGASQSCNGVTLAPQEACGLFLTFSPTAPGLFGGESTFAISDAPPPADSQEYHIDLSGCGAGGETPCSASCECPAAQDLSCLAAARASLAVDERKPGKEKLTASLSGFAEETTQVDLGDPADGAPRYDLCIYDAAFDLAHTLSVAGRDAPCGSKPCWKTKGDVGWRYRDPLGSADGVRKLVASSGGAGRGKLSLRASNNIGKDQVDLPGDIARSLEGEASATIQLRASGGRCYSGTLGSVERADGTRFKAKTE
jgi:hypothetical protein